MSDIVRLLNGIKLYTSGGEVSDLPETAADTITALRAEVERLKIENIQMQAALGYGILAEDERHILPSNPFKCGTCDASKHLRAEVERLRAVVEGIADLPPGYADMRQDDLVVILANKARAALEERK